MAGVAERLLDRGIKKADSAGSALNVPWMSGTADLLIFLGGTFSRLFAFLGLLRLLALVFLLAELGGELMPALVALAAQAEGAAGRSLGGNRFLKKKLQEHQAAAV